VKLLIPNLKEKLAIENFECLIKSMQESFKTLLESNLSYFLIKNGQTLTSSANEKEEGKKIYPIIESSLLSFQNSINQISRSNKIEYSQVKQDLNESFQSLFLNLNAMTEQSSN
jgi:hypothetical protein